jgi:hypothetical protein
MARLVAIAEVDDVARWEKGFRTRGELFKKLGVRSPVHFHTTERGEVVLLEEVDDVDGLLASLSSPEVVEAMEADGVRRDTVKVFVLDKTFTY